MITSAGVVSVSDDRIVTFGRLCFGVGLIGIGVQHLFFVQFFPVVVPLWPSWIPEQRLCVYIQHSATFWEGVFGFIKAIFWPAVLMYKLLEFLKMKAFTNGRS